MTRLISSISLGIELDFSYKTGFQNQNSLTVLDHMILVAKWRCFVQKILVSIFKLCHLQSGMKQHPAVTKYQLDQHSLIQAIKTIKQRNRSPSTVEDSPVAFSKK